MPGVSIETTGVFTELAGLSIEILSMFTEIANVYTAN